MSEPSSKDINEQKPKRISELKKARLVLTEAGLKALDEYKYKSGTCTILDNFLNQYWWTPCANLIPIWMAPNLVTLLGFFLVLFSFVLQVLIYCPDLGENMIAPNWVFLVSGICHFLYQTLDAIDGKQARRTGTSSPLGQLFDHGVDALCTTAIVLCNTTMLRQGFSIVTILSMFSVQLSFWFSQYAEHHTHTMEHAVGGLFGVTEAQLTAILVLIYAGFFGTDHYYIPLLGTQICSRDIFFVFCVLSGISISVVNCLRVVRTPGVDFKKALLQPIPILAVMTIGTVWTTIPTTRPLVVAGTFGMLSTYLTMWIILCAMTRIEYPLLPSILYPLPILFLVCYFEIAPNEVDLLLGAYACYVIYKLYKFVFHTIQEITAHLDIYCLTIKKKDN